MMDTPPTVGLQGAAELMQVEPETVRRMIRDGKIGAAKIGKQWVMLTREVLDYTERAIIAQTAERRGLRRPPAPAASRRSPQRARQVAAPQVAVPQQHPVGAVPGDAHDRGL